MHEQVKVGVKNSLPPQIKARMDRLSIKSITQLAEISKVPASTLYNCLGGYSKMTLETAVKVARALNMSLEYLAEIHLEGVDGFTEDGKLLSDRIKTYKS